MGAAPSEPAPQPLTFREVGAAWVARLPARPSAAVVRSQVPAARWLAENASRPELEAAFWGMDHLWPYNTEGWTLDDLKRNLARALAAARNHPELERQRLRQRIAAALTEGG